MKKAQIYKVGDRVVIYVDKNGRSDLEADLIGAREEGDITTKEFTSLMDAIDQKKTWVIHSVGQDLEHREYREYELQIEGTKVMGPWALPGEELRPARKVTLKKSKGKTVHVTVKFDLDPANYSCIKVTEENVLQLIEAMFKGEADFPTILTENISVVIDKPKRKS